MPQLQSKTMLGLAALLTIVLFLDFMGRLTPEAVDALKWLGGMFFAVRGVANLPGNQPPSTP